MTYPVRRTFVLATIWSYCPGKQSLPLQFECILSARLCTAPPSEPFSVNAFPMVPSLSRGPPTFWAVPPNKPSVVNCLPTPPLESRIDLPVPVEVFRSYRGTSGNVSLAPMAWAWSFEGGGKATYRSISMFRNRRLLVETLGRSPGSLFKA